MWCINPITLEVGGITRQFPCGMCRFCRKMRQSQWALRMMHERKYHEKAVFITLTYEDKHLPENGNLDKRELQLFIKRIRKAVYPEVIKYFACGEYGDKYGRPHYHIIMFGIGPGDYDLINREWGNGFIKVALVGRKQCKYCAKYVTKAPLGRSRRDKAKMVRTPEFQIQSRGIGLSWLLENAESVGARGIQVQGRQINLPRYYVNKLRSAGVQISYVEDIIFDRVQESRLRTAKWRASGLDDDGVNRRKKEIREQRAEEVKTQNEMYSKTDPDDQ